MNDGAMLKATCAHDARAGLGEGTCWDPREQCLWWIDIFARAIHRYDPATDRTRTFATPEAPGSLGLREKGGLVVAMTSGFYFFDPNRETFTPIVDPEADLSDTRFNDGKTDRQGRFWSGTTFDSTGKTMQRIGSLYRLDTNLTVHRMVEGIGISNGLAWSPDSRTMYFTDSSTPLVWAWDFDPIGGGLENRRVFIDLSPIDGIGDGATVDDEGCYWLTIPFKGKVLRYDPNGKLMQTVDLPTDVPTCCEFGGKELDILYITTATLRRSAEELAKQSFAGGLFAVKPGVKGLPAVPFAG
jgi:sugar lactone lactonase YvrE